MGLNILFPLEKAELIIEGEGKSVSMPVLFNPEQYDISRQVNYAKTQVTGLDNPIIQFLSGQGATLNLSLYFDTQNCHVPLGTDDDVTTLTKPIMKALYVDGKLHSPPKATFCWGSFSFSGVIVSAKESFIMFLPSGKPVRAKLDLTFEYVANPDLTKRQSPFESPDRTKARVLLDGGGLWRLSFQEYGDPALWRKIAVANNIDNPRLCPSGIMLKVPPL